MKQSKLWGYTTENSYGRVYTTAIGLKYIEGNKAPYWTLNSLLDSKRLRSMFKGIEVDQRLHLADDNGVPMYCVANGYYFYSQGKVDTLANHLRITTDEALELLDLKLSKAGFSAFCDTLRPVWKAESDALLQELKNLNKGAL